MFIFSAAIVAGKINTGAGDQTNSRFRSTAL